MATEDSLEMPITEWAVILMWSAPITMSALGHEGGRLSKLVLKLKQAICTYNG